MIGINGYGSGQAVTKDTYITTLKGLLDYSNGVPRKLKYDTTKIPPMVNAMNETIKGWCKT